MIWLWVGGWLDGSWRGWIVSFSRCAVLVYGMYEDRGEDVVLGQRVCEAETWDPSISFYFLWYSEDFGYLIKTLWLCHIISAMHWYMGRDGVRSRVIQLTPFENSTRRNCEVRTFGVRRKEYYSLNEADTLYRILHSWRISFHELPHSYNIHSTAPQQFELRPSENQINTFTFPSLAEGLHRTSRSPEANEP